MTEQTNKTYASGAVRSGNLPRFRDIDYGFLLRVAKAFSEGVPKYDKYVPIGHKNWKRGDVEFAVDVLDHMLNHAVLLKEKLLARLTSDYTYFYEFENDNETFKEREARLEEDHLGHLGANLVMLDYFERLGHFDPTFADVEDDTNEVPDTPPSDDGVTQLDEPESGLTTRIKQALGIS